MATIREFEATPEAASLIEGLRDFGYTLETALCDIIDNSLSAGATRIRVRADTNGADPKLAIIDNGRGMSEAELRVAMRPGSRNPLDHREKSDLGRFGLGLKTASFSQCRRLTVLTRQNGRASAAVWDLDHVATTNRWTVLQPDAATVTWASELDRDGTMVLWEQLDRVAASLDESKVTEDFTRRLTEAATHIGLVFHRFLVRERSSNPVAITLNDRSIEAIDPFNEKHPATVRGPEEVIGTHLGEIRVTAFTLPHHTKTSAVEWERVGGPEGYLRNQGFYVYRERRLIVRGTWFGLARQSELTKLARVRIELPNTMDDYWKINVLKAHAQPPFAVRAHLKRRIDTICATSQRAYTKRTVRETSENPVPVWHRVQNDKRVHYEVTAEHPAIAALMEKLDDPQSDELRRVLALVSAALPINALLVDLGDHPEQVGVGPLEDESLLELAIESLTRLRHNGVPEERALRMIEASPPFSAKWASLASRLTTSRSE